MSKASKWQREADVTVCALDSHGEPIGLPVPRRVSLADLDEMRASWHAADVAAGVVDVTK